MMRLRPFEIAAALLIMAATFTLGQDYSWQKPHAKVLPTGDLEWAPEPFEFRAGDSVKYIDYEAGDDANPGTKARPWKHHPWDADAQGNARAASGIHTYVFKRGVVYRGSLTTKESGEPGNPIRLTSEPGWGTGEAVICGSEVPTGWQKGANHPDIPDAGQVWYTDIDWNPRNVWLVDGDEITRIHLARSPNWTVTNPDDPQSNWWRWDNPQWWHWFSKRTDAPHFVKLPGEKQKAPLGIDKDKLTGPPEKYEGAYVWSEWGVVMGMPYALKVKKFLPEQNAVALKDPFYGRAVIAQGDRYYIEDKPHFLDSPGEFWFDKKGRRGGRLYIRLPNEADPNEAQVEVARHMNLIDSRGVDHLDIGGLTLRFTNTYWDLGEYIWRTHDVRPAAVRVLGPLRDVTVRNCKIVHVTGGIRFDQLDAGNVQDGMYIHDNEIRYTDHAAVEIKGGGNKKQATNTLRDVQFLRNRVHEIGRRSAYTDHNHCIWVTYLVDGEFAGNIITRTYGAGIFISPVKSSGQGGDAPFARVLIHHNKVVDPMLSSCDWGGIEVNQGGPAYIYNCVSDNPGPGSFSHAYYWDGGFKRYQFNCIAWGKRNDKDSGLYSLTAVQQIVSYQNTMFNNSYHRFVECFRDQTPQPGRQKVLGNVFSDVSDLVFRMAQPAKEEQAQNARDLALDATAEYALHTNAYTRNVFYKITGNMGCYTAAGEISKTLEEFRKVLQANEAMVGTVGETAESAPLVDADGHDFRPTAESAARDAGVKVFVPWGLYAMVGEWNFTLNQKDPTEVIDEHWYMNANFGERSTYYKMPMYPLQAMNVDAEDYVQGDLEDWTRGALVLNGEDQFCVLENSRMTGPYVAEVPGRRGPQRVFAPANRRFSPNIGERNVLVEIYFRTDGDSAGAGLVSHRDGAGYELSIGDDGGLVWTVATAADKAGTLNADATVNDGEWHHVVAEADRRSGRMTVYVDGKQVAETTEQAIIGGSLSNRSDLLVGKSSEGKLLAGAVDFVRIAQGTLEDAETDIRELYAWQFNGPQFRDFNGKRPADGKRDAGAIEYTE